jgi:hypothetical protein
MARPIRPKKPNAKKRAAAAAAAAAAHDKKRHRGLRGWLARWRDATRRAEKRAITPSAVTPREPGGVVAINVKAISVLKGKDGLFRGAPDPTMLVAAWSVRPSTMKTVLRSVFRFRLKGALPAMGAPDVERVVSSSLKASKAVVMVVAVFEENSGEDIRALATALEDPEHLHLVDISSATPTAAPHVATVRECLADPALVDLSPRGIVLPSGDASRTRSDTWVGGGAVIVKRGHASHRLNVQSADGHQDWVVEFETRWR